MISEEQIPTIQGLITIGIADIGRQLQSIANNHSSIEQAIAALQTLATLRDSLNPSQEKV